MVVTFQIDPDQTASLGETCAAITEKALNSFSEKARKNIASLIAKGAALYLHVELVPTHTIILALDPRDENTPAMELARWTGKVPEAIKRVLN